MAQRRRTMTLEEVKARAKNARDHLAAAQLIADLGDDVGMSDTGNSAASLAVLAGIAAADAICGAVLGERAAGESHSEAIDLLRRATQKQKLAPHLQRLIASKTEVHYSASLTTPARVAELMTAATRLVDGMDVILRELR